jgi:hypothetical protein
MNKQEPSTPIAAAQGFSGWHRTRHWLLLEAIPKTTMFPAQKEGVN